MNNKNKANLEALPHGSYPSVKNTKSLLALKITSSVRITQ